MKCFLRANSKEIRDRLHEEKIYVCSCASYKDAEWLVCDKPPYVHGVYPGNDEEEIGTEVVFGNKDTFKDVFLSLRRDYVDCGEDVESFIKAIKDGI